MPAKKPSKPASKPISGAKSKPKSAKKAKSAPKTPKSSISAVGLFSPTEISAAEKAKTALAHVPKPEDDDIVDVTRLYAVLSGYPADSEERKLADLLKAGTSKGLALAALAEDAGLDLVKLADIMEQNEMPLARIRALRHMGGIFEDMAKESRSVKKVCQLCYGKLRVPANMVASAALGLTGEIVCPQCSGEGTETKPGNIESRRMLFEEFGRVGKKGPLVAIQNNMNVAVSGKQAKQVTFGQRLLQAGRQAQQPPPQPKPVAVEAETVKPEGGKD